MRTAVRMNPLPALPQDGKISPKFAARLGRLKPEAKIHAVLLLRGRETSRQASRTRPTSGQRRAAIEEIRGGARDAFKEIDEILHRFGGRRLSEKPSALGTVPIESNAAGITALVDSNYVQAILEDQQISQVV